MGFGGLDKYELLNVNNFEDIHFTTAEPDSSNIQYCLKKQGKQTFISK